MTTTKLEIAGMHCSHCVRAVRGALEKIPGVKVEEVQIGSATVSHDPAQTSVATLTDAVADEGYEAAVAD
jgi:copper chaperone